MRGLPRAYPGQRIGLFGGSFDPAHEGHAHVARCALTRLQLDAVWWLVTPQNPLKGQSAPQAQRLASVKALRLGPRHVASDLETQLGTRFTVDTLIALKRRYPGVAFVFVMGADGMESFSRWRRWEELMHLAPLFIVARPGVRPAARFAKPFAPALRRGADRILARRTPPVFAYLPARLHPISSTALRKGR